MSPANRRHALLSVLGALAEPLEAKIEHDRSINDLFNDLDTSIIQRPWFRDPWTPAEWDAIAAFDQSWRAAVAKYHTLPPWRQFWTSSAGRNITVQAAALLAVLKC